MSERANGGANGLALYASISESFCLLCAALSAPHMLRCPVLSRIITLAPHRPVVRSLRIARLAARSLSRLLTMDKFNVFLSEAISSCRAATDRKDVPLRQIESFMLLFSVGSPFLFKSFLEGGGISREWNSKIFVTSETRKGEREVVVKGKHL